MTKQKFYELAVIKTLEHAFFDIESPYHTIVNDFDTLYSSWFKDFFKLVDTFGTFDYDLSATFAELKLKFRNEK